MPTELQGRVAPVVTNNRRPDSSLNSLVHPAAVCGYLAARHLAGRE
jgi:hypothetical protein